jgi:GNAT superfamily N-acetyltransferase
MGNFTINELPIPAAPGADGWEDFRAMAELRNTVEGDGYATDEMNFSAEELLPTYIHQQHDPKRLFVARVDGAVVARGVYETQADEASDYAWLQVQVHPEWRRQGIGTALADTLERLAEQEGRTTQVVYAVSPDGPGERIPAPTGFGSLPAGNPEVRFLLARGYRLEQIERGSRLPLDGNETPIRRHLESALAKAGPDYAVHYWIGRVPGRWREDVALLYTRMSTDAPTAGLEEPEDVWSVERLLDHEEAQAGSRRTTLTAAVEHLPSGHLAGFTELGVPAELERPVMQEDTLVLKEHRGHRLGLLLKAANLLHLASVQPGHPSVITFNAEENRPMLDVNEAIGFVPIGYEGAWKRVVR